MASTKSRNLTTLVGCFIISTQNCMHPIWGFLSVILHTYYHYETGFTLDTINNFILYFYLGIYVSYFVFPITIQHINISLSLFVYLVVNSIFIMGFTYIGSASVFYMVAFILGLAESLLVGTMNFMTVVLYPNNKSLAMGFCLSGISVAILIWSSIMTMMVNPDNLKLEESGVFPLAVSANIPGFLYSFGLFTFVLGMIGLVLIGNFNTNFGIEMVSELSKYSSMKFSVISAHARHEEKQEEIEEEKNSMSKLKMPDIELESPMVAADRDRERDIESEEALAMTEMEFLKAYVFTSQFGLFFLMSLIRNSYYIYTQNNFKVITMLNINDDHFVSYIASVTFILNFGFRIAGGYFMDKYGISFTNQATFLSYFVISAIYILYPSSRLLFVVAIALIRISSGVNEILINGSCYIIYGKEPTVRILKYYMLMFVLSPVVCDIVEALFLKSGGYSAVLFVLTVIVIGGMAVDYKLKLMLKDKHCY